MISTRDHFAAVALTAILNNRNAFSLTTIEEEVKLAYKYADAMMTERLEKEHAERQLKEAEAARLAAEKAEQDRLEQIRLDAERAERERLAKERAEKDARERAARGELELESKIEKQLPENTRLVQVQRRRVVELAGQNENDEMVHGLVATKATVVEKTLQSEQEKAEARKQAELAAQIEREREEQVHGLRRRS